MKPLLWKEAHDLRGWLLAGLGLTASLELLFRIDATFVGVWMEVLMPLAAMIVAIGLAAGQIARERHTRTLEFLLARPISPGAIVWPKFIAGSAVLLVLVASAVALSYAGPVSPTDTGLRIIRDQVGLVQMMAALLPRFWFVYSLTLLFSVLVDRSLKAAGLAAVVVLTVAAAAVAFASLAPFSGFVYWLPFHDITGGLIDAARNWRISAMTGAVYSLGAILAAMVSAALLKRSPERYLGNAGVVAAGMMVVAAAVGSAAAAAHRLPVAAPMGSLEIQTSADSSSATIFADGTLAALTVENSILFVDLSRPAQPKQIAEVRMRGWSSSSDWNMDRAALAGDTVYWIGQKKQVPVDEIELAIVRPSGLVKSIALAPAGTGDYRSAPLPLGGLIYFGITHDRICSLAAIDPESGREVSSLTIDRMRPPEKGVEEGSAPVRLLRRGSYLYVNSPSYLTAVDISDPARPFVSGQVAVRPRLSFLYGFPRPLAWQGDRLFEIGIWPPSMASYDLSDPAHPSARTELIYHGGMTMTQAGRSLYQPWREGILEFRAERGALQCRRYLRGDRTVSSLATAGEYIYALTAADLQHPRMLQVFRR